MLKDLPREVSARRKWENIKSHKLLRTPEQGSKTIIIDMHTANVISKRSISVYCVLEVSRVSSIQLRGMTMCQLYNRSNLTVFTCHFIQKAEKILLYKLQRGFVFLTLISYMAGITALMGEVFGLKTK